MKTLSKELTDYLDQYTFVNQYEVNSAVFDWLEENQETVSIDEAIDCGFAADEYIKLRNLKFDADLVITIDYDNRKINIKDLNGELNDEQVQKIENIWNIVLIYAVDCMKHNLPKEHYENLASKHGLDVNAIERLRSAADQFLYPDYPIEG